MPFLFDIYGFRVHNYTRHILRKIYDTECRSVLCEIWRVFGEEKVAFSCLYRTKKQLVGTVRLFVPVVEFFV